MRFCLGVVTVLAWSIAACGPFPPSKVRGRYPDVLPVAETTLTKPGDCPPATTLFQGTKQSHCVPMPRALGLTDNANARLIDIDQDQRCTAIADVVAHYLEQKSSTLALSDYQCHEGAVGTDLLTTASFSLKKPSGEARSFRVRATLGNTQRADLNIVNAGGTLTMWQTAVPQVLLFDFDIDLLDLSPTLQAFIESPSLGTQTLFGLPHQPLLAALTRSMSQGLGGVRGELQANPEYPMQGQVLEPAGCEQALGCRSEGCADSRIQWYLRGPYLIVARNSQDPSLSGTSWLWSYRLQAADLIRE